MADRYRHSSCTLLYYVYNSKLIVHYSAVCDDVTLCVMMWHYVWWCDTVCDDVTLCVMMW